MLKTLILIFCLTIWMDCFPHFRWGQLSSSCYLLVVMIAPAHAVTVHISFFSENMHASWETTNWHEESCKR